MHGNQIFLWSECVLTHKSHIFLQAILVYFDFATNRGFSHIGRYKGKRNQSLFGPILDHANSCFGKTKLVPELCVTAVTFDEGGWF